MPLVSGTSRSEHLAVRSAPHVSERTGLVDETDGAIALITLLHSELPNWLAGQSQTIQQYEPTAPIATHTSLDVDG
jgi:hypothetical protein